MIDMTKRIVTLVFAICLFLGLIACKKSKEIEEIVSDDYTITVECLDMTSLSGDNFVGKLKVDDARVIKNGTLLAEGEYSFQHKGHNILAQVMDISFYRPNDHLS